MQSSNMIMFALPGNEVIAARLYENLKAVKGEVTLRRFPDGESYVRVLSEVKEKCVVLVCTLNQPDEKLLPLYFLSRTIRGLGAKCVCLVTPYLAYMRQDKVFHEGEGVTSGYFAELISGFADSLITIDPHLHRRSSLSELYTIPNAVLHAANEISAWIRGHVEKPVLIGPDSESEQWVADVAKGANAPFLVLEKVRHGDRNVEISVPDLESYGDHTPVLVDDIISTAQTMIQTVIHLKQKKAKAPICIGVHGVFAGTAYDDLEKAGAAQIVTCNTIPHPSNDIDLSNQIAEHISHFMHLS